MDFFDGEMADSDRRANAGAVFHPAIEADDNNGTYCPPGIEVGGVSVYVYVRDGILVVSGHFDEVNYAGNSPFRLYGDYDSVPVVVKMGDGESVWEAFPDDAVPEYDAKVLRKTGELRKEDWVLPGWVDDD